ncbi:heavy metal-binding protein HIP-like [Mercenaria mercenaria]|uniref:heavy metal-binding protein HIP-like n=1 Tax=Mercenaria mercenaria TaxID=6596 RepID=UPI00234E790C|nr:heavy metal-binding protein HIP-like [Mercenaria mercenaria]
MCRTVLFFVILICFALETARSLSQDETIKLLLNEMAYLKRQVKRNEELSESQYAELKVLKNEVQRLSLGQTKLTAENKQLRSQKCDIPNEKFKRILMSEPQSETNVAFSTSLTNHMTNLGNQQTIVFDHVFTNVANAYSPVTGVFTAPQNGTYFFTATIMCHYGQYLETQFALNGQGLVHMYCNDSAFEQGTNSIVLSLKPGDKVWVRHMGNEGSNVYGYNWSTFSGFQIFISIVM